MPRPIYVQKRVSPQSEMGNIKRNVLLIETPRGIAFEGQLADKGTLAHWFGRTLDIKTDATGGIKLEAYWRTSETNPPVTYPVCFKDGVAKTYREDDKGIYVAGYRGYGAIMKFDKRTYEPEAVYEYGVGNQYFRDAFQVEFIGEDPIYLLCLLQRHYYHSSYGHNCRTHVCLMLDKRDFSVKRNYADLGSYRAQKMWEDDQYIYLSVSLGNSYGSRYTDVRLYRISKATGAGSWGANKRYTGPSMYVMHSDEPFEVDDGYIFPFCIPVSGKLEYSGHKITPSGAMYGLDTTGISISGIATNINDRRVIMKTQLLDRTTVFAFYMYSADTIDPITTKAVIFNVDETNPMVPVFDSVRTQLLAPTGIRAVLPIGDWYNILVVTDSQIRYMIYDDTTGLFQLAEEIDFENRIIGAGVDQLHRVWVIDSENQVFLIHPARPVRINIRVDSDILNYTGDPIDTTVYVSARDLTGNYLEIDVKLSINSPNAEFFEGTKTKVVRTSRLGEVPVGVRVLFPGVLSIYGEQA